MPPPSPRSAVANPSLTRPDWLASEGRDLAALWLDKNENLDPELLKVTSGILSSIDPLALCTYPECGPLYRKLGDFLGMAPDQLILSAGSDGAIRYAFEAFVGEGDVVIHTTPTFAMYPVYSSIYGAEVHALPYEPSDWGPRLDARVLRSAILQLRPRLVCLPNPDSPTGTVFPLDDLSSIIEAAGQAGAVILIDEAYHPFYESSVIDWTKRYQNLIVARTFAKAWGLAGLRIGYAAACPELMRFLHKVRPMYEVNTLSVVFMERMLDHSADMMASVKRLNDGKAYFLSEMSKLGFKTLQNHGNFLHVAFGHYGPRIHEALKRNVLYRLDFREPCLAGFSRFSSTTRAQFQPVIDRIKDSILSVTQRKGP